MNLMDFIPRFIADARRKYKIEKQFGVGIKTLNIHPSA